MTDGFVCELCGLRKPCDLFEPETDRTVCFPCDGLRQCTKCRRWLSLDTFSKSGRAKGGWTYWRSECRRCEGEAQAARRATERGREQKRKQDARRWTRIKQALAAARSATRAAGSGTLGPPTAPARAAGSGTLGPPKIGRPSVAQLNAAALAAVPTKATAKVWASGHDPADYPGFAAHLFDLPGFDPLDLSTWPDDSL